MPDLTLDDLVRNGTMSPEIAATLATTGAERRSFVCVAIPRLAGKSTVMRAILAEAPAGTAMHQLSTAAGGDLGIPRAGDEGYLLVSEISPAGFEEYLWGPPVRHVFGALERGFSLATALHATGVDEAFAVICGRNRVPDEQAARIDLVVYIEVFGRSWQRPDARRVAEVHEIEGVERGVPIARLLHRRNEDDTFEVVEPPRLLDTGRAHAARLARFRAALDD